MELIKHPGKRVNELLEENHSLRRQLLAMEHRLSSAIHQLDSAHTELSIHDYDLSAIPPIPMTKQVLEWVSEFGVTWEILYCPSCKSWFSELDKLFPYHQEFCICKCEENGGANG